LFARGQNAILKKIGEEATEVVIAATSELRERLVSEIADLAFHVLVLMVEREIEPDEIARELESRVGKRRAD
jgi:phosphoribosyl-ATP pyrophosphohydrolase